MGAKTRLALACVLLVILILVIFGLSLFAIILVLAFSDCVIYVEQRFHWRYFKRVARNRIAGGAVRNGVILGGIQCSVK